MDKTRKVPVLASVLSIVTILGSAHGLLRLLHIVEPHASLDQQSMLFREFYAFSNVCSLVAGILLWRLRPMAFYFSLAAALLAIYPSFAIKPAGHHLLVGLAGLSLDLAVTAYIWHVTSPRYTERTAI